MQSGKECVRRGEFIQIIKNPLRHILELGLSLENKGELSVRDDVINFAFHQIYDESNMEKKLGVGLEMGRLESSQCERQGLL